jgi:hypothetical protein
VSESAVRDKPLLVHGLARNRRSQKRPSEPRGQTASTRKMPKFRKFWHANSGNSGTFWSSRQDLF